MAKKEEKKEEAPVEAAPAPKSKKKLIIIIVALLLVVGGGAGAFLVLGAKSPPAEGAEEEEHLEEDKDVTHLKLAKLDPFIVNLGENTAFLKVSILVEYDPSILERAGGGHGEGGGGGYGGGGSGGGKEADATAMPPEMSVREPMIRDRIIRVLSSKKTEDVLSPEGKEKLKEELIEGINEAIGLSEGPVVNLYFTDFIIQ